MLPTAPLVPKCQRAATNSVAGGRFWVRPLPILNLCPYARVAVSIAASVSAVVKNVACLIMGEPSVADNYSCLIPLIMLGAGESAQVFYG